MKKALLPLLGLLALLLFAPSAGAAVTKILDGDGDLVCTTGPNDNRFCGDFDDGSLVGSFDHAPIDVFVALPPEPGLGGTDGAFPVVGIFHGWGEPKVDPRTNPLALGLLSQGIAVVTTSHRGWNKSCGGPHQDGQGAGLKDPPCADGYIHMMHNAFEVRDAQTILGKLADERTDEDDAYLIDPDAIGAAGGSYGGGISSALAMLKDRVQLEDGSYIPWESPDGQPMQIAAAAPQYTWSDFAAGLIPNGHTLDYTTENPYSGPQGQYANGTPKSTWLNLLFLSGYASGYYAPPGHDPRADMLSWYPLVTGSPDDYSTPAIDALRDEITENHSAYYIPIDDDVHKPAPMLLSNSWNDDLFPLSEAVRLYNKVRTSSPTTPVVLWGIDIGHMRSNGNNPARTEDATTLIQAQVVWMVRHLKHLPAPFPVEVSGLNPLGGSVATSSKCFNQERVPGEVTVSDNWASSFHGEVLLEDADPQTIDHAANPTDSFAGYGSTTVCTYGNDVDPTSGAAIYETAPAQFGGWTILGTPTVEATLRSSASNNVVVARLLDVAPDDDYVRLISRAIYRPVNSTGVPTAQTFQLQAQNYLVEEGHKLRLELVQRDSGFALDMDDQDDVTVADLRLKIPVKEDAADDPGDQIEPISPRTVPAGSLMNADFLASDTWAPQTEDDLPGDWQNTPVTVTLEATDTGVSGVEKTYYKIGENPVADTASAIYDPDNKPTLGHGQKISYMSVDNAGNAEVAGVSGPVVDEVAPVTTDDVPVVVPSAPVVVTLAPTDDLSGVERTYYAVGVNPVVGLGSPVYNPLDRPVLAAGERIAYFSVDHAGNAEAPKVSAPVTPVVPPAPTPTPTPAPAPAPAKAKLKPRVTVRGKARVGRTIHARVSTTAGGKKVAKVKYTYRWKIGKRTIGKRAKLKLNRKWRRKRIVLQVTAKKAGFRSVTVRRTATKRLR